MKFKNLIAVMLILLVGAVGLTAISAYSDDGQIVDGLNSTSDLNQAIDDAKTENKTVMLLFDQENCYYCDLLKEDVLTNHEVQDILNNEFILVCVDVNRQGSLAAEFQVYGTPDMIFLDGNGNIVNRIDGYVPADEFLDSIKEI